MKSAWGTHLGLISYPRALELQTFYARFLAAHRDAPEILLTLEHPPTVTLGKRAGPADLVVPEAALAARGVALYRVGRGGQATYHGPGQLVFYPLCRVGRNVRAHVSALARAGRQLLEELGVDAHWLEDRPGLYVDGRKIGAVGVQVTEGVSLHGMALNITVDLDGFQLIVPCGQPSAPVTSVAAEGGRLQPLSSLGMRLMEIFALVTGRKDLKIFQSPHLLAEQLRRWEGDFPL